MAFLAREHFCLAQWSVVQSLRCPNTPWRVVHLASPPGSGESGVHSRGVADNGSWDMICVCTSCTDGRCLFSECVVRKSRPETWSMRSEVRLWALSRGPGGSRALARNQRLSSSVIQSVLTSVQDLHAARCSGLRHVVASPNRDWCPHVRPATR